MHTDEICADCCTYDYVKENRRDMSKKGHHFIDNFAIFSNYSLNKKEVYCVCVGGGVGGWVGGGGGKNGWGCRGRAWWG